MAERKRSFTYSLTSFSVPSADQHAPVARAQAQAGQVFLVHGDDPLAAALGKNHVGLDQPRLFAVVEPARARIECANKLDAGMRLFRALPAATAPDLSRRASAPAAGGSHDLRGHLHRAPPLFEFGLGLGPEAAMGSSSAMSLSLRWCAYTLLNSACCAAIWISRHSRRSRAATPAGSRCCTRSMPRSNCSINAVFVLVLVLLGIAESLGQLFVADREVSVFIQVADDELRGHGQLGSSVKAPSCHAR